MILLVLFCVIGRPDNVPTYTTLKESGYTGKIYIICDDEDTTISHYKSIFGDTNVKVFKKDDYLDKFDLMNNEIYKKCAVYARNACFDIAKELRIKIFL